MKRVRAAEYGSDQSESEAESCENEAFQTTNAAVSEIRQQLLEAYVSGGAICNAVWIAKLCHWISKAGLEGLEDLALSPETAPKHASDKLKILLSKDYHDPELVFINTPVMDKRLSTRVSTQIPIRLPSAIFNSEQIKNEPPGPDPLLAENLLDQESFTKHPVVQANKELHWSRIIPIAMYFDGVSYTKHDSFWAFYVRNLRTGVQELCILIRASAA